MQTETIPESNIPGKLRHPSYAELDNYFKTAGWKEGFTYYNKKNTHWRGIFQTYLLKQAGIACHWNREIVDDSGGEDLEITTGKEAQTGLAVGDIVKVSYGQHHFLVIEPVKT